MKHLFNHLPKLAAVAAIALSMSSCNRAEYAMLPKTTPYHATYHGTAKPAPAPAVAAEKAVVAEAPTTVVVEEKNTQPEVAVASAPATAASAAVAAAPAAPAAAKPAAAAKPKLRLVERLAVNKMTKQLTKYAPKLQLKQKSETAEAKALSGNLRTGVILLLIGLLVSLFSGINGIFGLIGGIIAIVGLIFIILWLLDEL